MHRLQNKIILITGANSEIALAFIRLALTEGARHVVLSGIHLEKDLQKLQLPPGKCSFLHLDVCREADWENAFGWLERQFGKLDVLVNNAGITGAQLPSTATNIEDCTLDTWRHVQEVNLDGIFLGCKHLIPLLAKSEAASIVNIGSRSGLVGRPDRIAYAASKAAVSNLGKSVAIYCAEKGYNIRCNTILPSFILTSMWEPILGPREQHNETQLQRLSEKVPLRRFGAPEEVAGAILFLASDEASYINGIDLLVDGGAQAKDVLR